MKRSEFPGKAMSRRQAFQRAAVAVPAMAALAGQAAGQNAPPAPAGQQASPRPPRMPQGGSGPIRVLLITKNHPYDREPFYQMFDSFGQQITWTHVDHPAAQVFFDPVRAEPYDVFVLYDMIGRGRRPKPDGTPEVFNTEPSPELKAGMKALVQQGKGFVFFHHAIGSWPNWPEYTEIMGGAGNWDLPLNVRGKEIPFSGYRGGVQEHITVIDKTHPVVQGLGDSFDIVDEVFLTPIFEDSVHPLLRTDFKNVDSNYPMQTARGWHHPEGSSLTGWVKASEKSPVVYTQHGHDATAWANPAFRTFLSNAIVWVASKEAKAWAAANSTKIFKT